jgi:hypothetical protein
MSSALISCPLSYFNISIYLLIGLGLTMDQCFLNLFHVLSELK